MILMIFHQALLLSFVTTMIFPDEALDCFSEVLNLAHDFQCKSNDWFLYKMQHWAEMG